MNYGTRQLTKNQNPVLYDILCRLTNENHALNTDELIEELKMTLPLADLTDIQPYAFKTKAIKTFTPVTGEEDRSLNGLLMSEAGMSSFQNGMYVYALAGSGDPKAIVKYVGAGETKQMQNSAGENTDITIQNAQLIAIAGGGDYSNPSSGLALGFSYRYYDANFAKFYPQLVSNVFSYEIMEGSVYYGGETLQIYIGIVSKVHENAFTDIEDEAPIVKYYNCSYDQHLTLEQVTGQDITIFEEGWFDGRANSENTFMAETTIQDSKYPLM